MTSDERLDMLERKLEALIKIVDALVDEVGDTGIISTTGLDNLLMELESQ